jgi:hypothetical protein
MPSTTTNIIYIANDSAVVIEACADLREAAMLVQALNLKRGEYAVILGELLVSFKDQPRLTLEPPYTQESGVVTLIPQEQEDEDIAPGYSQFESSEEYYAGN